MWNRARNIGHLGPSETTKIGTGMPVDINDDVHK